MYGLIMLTVKDLVVNKYSQKDWERICDEAKLPYDFVTNHRYEDAALLGLISAAVRLLSVPQNELIEAVGYWFIIYVKNSTNYGKLLSVMGSTLPEVLNNVNNMHAHLLKVAHFPEITSPTFQITHVKPNSLHLHYTTGDPARGSLFCPLVVGLIKSIGDEMNIPQVSVKQIRFKSRGAASDVFRIRWSDRTKGGSSIKEAEDEESSEMPTSSVASVISEKIGIDGKTLGRLLPFHILFNKEGVIMQSGHSMQRVVGAEIGDSMETYFTLVAPAPEQCSFSKWKTILKYSTQDLFRLSHQYDDDTSLIFEGEVVFVKTAKAFLFACTPVLRSLDEATYFGLSLRDFALGDKASKVTMLLANAREQDVQNFNSALAVEREKMSQVEKAKKEKTGLLGALRRGKKKDANSPPGTTRAIGARAPSFHEADGNYSFLPSSGVVKFDEVDLGAVHGAGERVNTATLSSGAVQSKVAQYESGETVGPLPSKDQASQNNAKRMRSSSSGTITPIPELLEVSGSKRISTSEESGITISGPISRAQSGSYPNAPAHLVMRQNVPVPGRTFVAFQEMLLSDSWHGFPLMRLLLNMDEVRDDEYIYALVLDFYTQTHKEELLLRTLFHAEIRGTAGSEVRMESLFREASAATKLWGRYLDRITEEYVAYLTAPLLSEVARYEDPLEVDERRYKKESKQSMEANQKALVEISQNFLHHLIKSLNRVPAGARRVLIFVTQELARSTPEMRLRAVANLFFLRFISPLLISPTTKRTPATQRTLTLVSKLLYNLFNETQFGSKEPTMMPLNAFLTPQNFSLAQQFLEDLIQLRPSLPVNATEGTGHRDTVPMTVMDERAVAIRQAAVDGIKQVILENIDRVWDKAIDDAYLRGQFKQFFSVTLCGIYA